MPLPLSSRPPSVARITFAPRSTTSSIRSPWIRRPRASCSSENDPSTTSSLDALDSLLSSSVDGENNDPTQPKRVPVAKQDAAPRTSFLNPGRQTGRFINEAVLRSDVTAGRATLLGEPVDLPRAPWPPVAALSLAAAQLLTMLSGGASEVDSFVDSTTDLFANGSPLDLLFAAHASSNDALAAVVLLALLGTEAEAVYGSWRALAIYAASTGAGVAAALLAIAALGTASTTTTTTTCCVASAGAVGLAAAAAASARANGSLPWLNLLTDRFVGGPGVSDSPTASKVRWGVFWGVVVAAVALETADINRISPIGSIAATLSAASLTGFTLGSFLCPRWQLQRDVQLEDGAMSLPAEATLLLSSRATAAAAAPQQPPSQQQQQRNKLRTVVVAVDRRGDLERSVALFGAAVVVSLALKIGMAAVAAGV